jgi:hypothetical protein
VTGPEHYKVAESLLAAATLSGEHPDGSPIIRKDEPEALAAAQVHATLALAAAHAMGIGDLPSPDWDAWREVAQTRDQKGHVVD